MPEQEIYTHGHHPSVLRSHRWRTAENSAAYLLPHLRPGTDLLDVGCGPGTITLDLAALVAPGRTRGVDAAAAVLEEARTGAAERGVEVDFAVDDAYALQADDDSFDVVHAHQVLQHLVDPVAALAEWARVTRPGGTVAARDADYDGMKWYPLDPRLDRWMELYQVAARANGGEPDAGRRMLAWAHAAGLSDVTPTASIWCYADEASRQWWGGAWAERVTTSALADQLTSAGLAGPEELADIADGFRAWASHPDAWWVIPHGEVLCRVS
jgi:ubiquinone/menaquinone biosynthesis C-methylase UbiE